MKCTNTECENYNKETTTIAMVQINHKESCVYAWDEINGLGRDLDSQYGESPSEHDKDPKRIVPYIYSVECRYCMELLINFE